MEDKDELILTASELKDLFKKGTLKDTNNGWYYDDIEVQLIALHEVEPKYLSDIIHAKYYKLVKIEK